MRRVFFAIASFALLFSLARPSQAALQCRDFLDSSASTVSETLLSTHHRQIQDGVETQQTHFLLDVNSSYDVYDIFNSIDSLNRLFEKYVQRELPFEGFLSQAKAVIIQSQSEVRSPGLSRDKTSPFTVMEVFRAMTYTRLSVGKRQEILNRLIEQKKSADIFLFYLFDLKLRPRDEFRIRFWQSSPFRVGLGSQAVIKTLEWTSAGNLRKHFEKHGLEFDAKTEHEYEAASIRFARSADENSIVYFKPGRGAYFKFNMLTREILLTTPSGEIMTYFKSDPNHVQFVGFANRMLKEFFERD